MSARAHNQRTEAEREEIRPWYERLGEPQDEAHHAQDPGTGARAPTASPAASREPGGRLQRWGRYAVLTVAGLILGFVLGVHVESLQAVGHRYDGKDYAASPHFTLEGFRQVQAGMTEDQVRDLVGIPCQRYGGMGDAVGWRYTFPTRRGPCRHTFCSVVFDSTTRRVTYALERQWEDYNIWEPGYDYVHRDLEEVRLEDPGRPPLVLTAADPAAHVILAVSLENTRRTDIEAEVEKEAQHYREAGLAVHLVKTSGPGDWPGAYTGCSVPMEPWAGCYGSGKPCGVFIYHRGVLYQVLSWAPYLYPEQSRGDRQWLLQRLMLEP